MWGNFVDYLRYTRYNVQIHSSAVKWKTCAKFQIFCEVRMFGVSVPSIAMYYHVSFPAL